MNIDCRLCNKATETAEHLFLHRESSQDVLFSSPMSPGTIANPNTIVQDYIASWLAEDEKYFKFKMENYVFWALWKDINNIVFNNGKFNIKT